MGKLINLDNLTRYDSKIKDYVKNNGGNYKGVQHHSSSSSSDIGTSSSKRLHLSELSVGKHLFTNSGSTYTLYYDYISDGSGTTPTTSTGSKTMYDVSNSSVYSNIYEVEMYIDISGGVKGNTSGDVIGTITWYPWFPSTSTSDTVKYKIYVNNANTGTIGFEPYIYLGSGYATYNAYNSANSAYNMANTNSSAISALDSRVTALESGGSGGEQQFGKDVLVYWSIGSGFHGMFSESKSSGPADPQYSCMIDASLDFSKSNYLQLNIHTDDMYGSTWDTLNLPNARIDLYTDQSEPTERTLVASFTFGDLTVSPIPTSPMSYTSSIASTDPGIMSGNYYAKFIYGESSSGSSVEQMSFADFLKSDSNGQGSGTAGAGSYYIDWDSLKTLSSGAYILTLFPTDIPDLSILRLTNGGQSLQDSFSYTTLTCIFIKNDDSDPYFRGQLTISGANLSYQYILFCESPSGSYYVSGKKVQMMAL